MKSWMERLGLMLAMLAMLLVASVPAMADHNGGCDDWDWDHDEEEWVCVDDEHEGDEEESDEEEFDGIELAAFEIEAEVVCWYDGNWDELDGWDNDGDLEIDEGDIDCEIVWE